MRTFVLLGLLAASASAGCDPAPALDWDHPTAVGSAPDPVDAGVDEIVFAAIGDFGEEGEPQTRVAGAVADACVEAGGCDFALTLGDNLYDFGLNGSEEAEQRLRALVDSYPQMPKFMVLGNHDWHAIRTELSRAQRELEWIAEQDDVFGAFHYYDFRAGPAQFHGMDSNWIVRHLDSDEATELDAWGQTIGASDAPWTFTFGHHPILSNGRHGNAGDYRDTGLDLWPGTNYRAFLDEHVIGTADLHLAGHDHNLNFFPGTGGPNGDATATLVSGSAAKCRGLGPVSANPGTGDAGTGVTATYEFYGFGFALVRVTDDELVVTMHAEGMDPWTTRRSLDSVAWTIDGDPFIDTSSHCE
ncbi:MAG: metallophosphoesterase [Deltaproteobacteria bacterium]|nr:metallophosphoesterase [Deltaproteobacteria bacterium]